MDTSSSRRSEPALAPAAAALSASGSPQVVTGGRRALLATLLFCGVTLLFLHPLVSARASLQNGDLLGHAWGLAWVNHQLWRDPLRLYQANIYYPEPKSLRLTESLVPQALMVSPLAALETDPIALVNAATLLSFVLSGLCAYALALHVCRSFSGALFAGLAYAFCGYRSCHLMHVGVLSTQWFPLILLLVWRQLEEPRSWRTLALAAVLWAQALSSGYYAYPAAGLVLLGVLLAGRRSWSMAALTRIAFAVLLGAIATYPFAAPYLELAQETPQRSLAAVIHWSARPGSYLTPSPYATALPHLAALSLLGDEREPLYPGSAVLLLAGAAFARPRHRFSLPMLVIGAVAFALSLGPLVEVGSLALPGPYAAMRLLPLGGMMRVPARLGIGVQLALALLAGIGWAALEREQGRARIALLAAALGLWAAESYPRDALRPVREIETPPSAAWLAQSAPGPVLELPYYGEGRHGLYVYWSTKHWHPLVNGHGTFRAARAVPLAIAGRSWPSPKSVKELRQAGVRYVVTHSELARGDDAERYRRAAARAPNGVALRFESGGDAVFEIEAGIATP